MKTLSSRTLQLGNWKTNELGDVKNAVRKETLLRNSNPRPCQSLTRDMVRPPTERHLRNVPDAMRNAGRGRNLRRLSVLVRLKVSKMKEASLLRRMEKESTLILKRETNLQKKSVKTST